MSSTLSPSLTSLIQKYNLDISIVEVSNIYESRLDPEFYSLEYIKIENKDSKSLNDLGIKVFSGPFGSFLKSESYVQIGNPFVRISDVKDIFLSKTGMMFLDDSEFARMKKYHLEVDDIVLSKVGTVGRLSIITPEIGTIAVSENNIGIKFSDHPQVLKLYIFIFLISKYGQSEFQKFSSGNVQPKLNVSDVGNFKIPLPSPTFQSSIAELVGEAHKQRELSKSLYAEAENILLSELGLVNWKPSEENITEKMSSEVEFFGRCDAEFFQPKYDELLGKLKKFEIKKLSEMCKIQRGSLISPEFYNENEGIPYLRGADFSSGNLGEDKLMYIDKSFIRTNEQRVSKDDIIFATIGSVGTSALVNDKFDNCYLSNNTGKLSIRNKKEVLPIVLQLILQSIIGKLQFERFETRTAQPKISNEQVGMIQVPILPDTIQSLISEKIIASHMARESSKKLLEKAKRAVEIFIEEDEDSANKYLG
ncbi:MAG: restriction endonuclease subunit S [Candidatus Gracilibacteria bacterium]|nr:restriction endonuclease subunit S [Candidatus Gracilibacteria bacterium]